MGRLFELMITYVLGSGSLVKVFRVYGQFTFMGIKFGGWRTGIFGGW